MHDIFLYFIIISSAGSFLASIKHIYCGDDNATIRWPPRGVTALQVVRTSFLGPRPRLFLPPPLFTCIV